MEIRRVHGLLRFQDERPERGGLRHLDGWWRGLLLLRTSSEHLGHGDLILVVAGERLQELGRGRISEPVRRGNGLLVGLPCLAGSGIRTATALAGQEIPEFHNLPLVTYEQLALLDHHLHHQPHHHVLPRVQPDDAVLVRQVPTPGALLGDHELHVVVDEAGGRGAPHPGPGHGGGGGPGESRVRPGLRIRRGMRQPGRGAVVVLVGAPGPEPLPALGLLLDPGTDHPGQVLRLGQVGGGRRCGPGRTSTAHASDVTFFDLIGRWASSAANLHAGLPS
mmetsp:Transcript_40796/g.100406  ORF Transcript_40796/g.100406 Transcript_40796/m.100406 type:complete len:278 (-) Transcript_40796:4-837(-)